MSSRKPAELRALRALFEAQDPTPDEVVDVAYQAPDLVREWANTHAAGLELVSDSADAPASAAVRSWHARPGTRVLTFSMPGRILEVDLIPTTPGTVRASGMVISRAGQGVPTGEVVVRHPDGECAGEIDQHGGFRVENVPRGPLSVVYRPARSAPAVADWLVC